MRILVENITVEFIAATVAMLNTAAPVTGVKVAAVYQVLEDMANEYSDTEIVFAIADALETVERHAVV